MTSCARKKRARMNRRHLAVGQFAFGCTFGRALRLIGRQMRIKSLSRIRQIIFRHCTLPVDWTDHLIRDVEDFLTAISVYGQKGVAQTNKIR